MRHPRQTRPVHRRDVGAVARPRPPGDGGTAAVEYAFVAPVFVALLFFVIEVCWQLTVDMALHIGAAAGSRYAVTGAGLADGSRDGAVRNKVLSAAGGILKSDRLTLDAQAFADPASFLAGGQATASAGASGEFVIYRVTYRQEFITPVAPLLRMLAGYGVTSPIVHTANLVAQNEPF